MKQAILPPLSISNLQLGQITEKSPYILNEWNTDVRAAAH